MMDYLKEVRAELDKVVWPTRRQTLILTVAVVLVSIGTSLYLGLSDYALQAGLQYIVNRW